MRSRVPVITRKARTLLLHASIKLVEIPLIIASMTTWYLESIRTRLRTAVAMAEMEDRE